MQTQPLAKTQFVISATASTKKAGSGKDEQLLYVESKWYTSLDLMMKKKNSFLANWRRVLDDSFMIDIKVDGDVWASVEHYKYAQYFIDDQVYMKSFTKNGKFGDKDSSFLKKTVVSKTGVHKKEKIRPKGVLPKVPENLDQSLKRARLVKFSVPQLKEILCATKDALLMRYDDNKDLVRFVGLMVVRAEVCPKPQVVSGEVGEGPKKRKHTAKPKPKLGGARVGKRPDGFEEELVRAVATREDRLQPKIKKQILERSKAKNKPAPKKPSTKSSKHPNKLYKGTVLDYAPHPPMKVVTAAKKIPEPQSVRIDAILNPSPNYVKKMEAEFDAAVFLKDFLKYKKYKKNKKRLADEKAAADKVQAASAAKSALLAAQQKANGNAASKIQRAVRHRALKKAKDKSKRAEALVQGASSAKAKAVAQTYANKSKKDLDVAIKKSMVKPMSFKPSMKGKSSTRLTKVQLKEKKDMAAVEHIPDGFDKRKLVEPQQLSKKERIQTARLAALAAAEERDYVSDRKKYDSAAHSIRSSCPFCKKVVIPEDVSTAEKSRYYLYICKHAKCPQVGAVLGTDEYRQESMGVTGKRTTTTEMEFTGDGGD